MPLTSSDRERFAKLLAVLGSDHAGERDNAALASSACGASRWNWEEVLRAPRLEFTVPPWPATGLILARELPE